MSEMSEPIPSKRRVIVVDDERLIADTLATILNNAGYDARAVYSGEQLVELLESFQPEVLIADVVMPGMTGIQIPFLRSSVLYRQTSWILGRSGSSSRRPTVPAAITRRSVAAAPA